MSASIGSTDHLPNNPCPGPRRSFYTFSHDRKIKRFTPLGFGFATCIGFVQFPSAFYGYFLGSLGLMIPQGFSDPIAGFANPHNETRRDTPYLTIGHTPLSFGGFATSSRCAFAFRSHSASTSATHILGRLDGGSCFYIFFSRASTPSTRSATATATYSAWWVVGIRRSSSSSSPSSSDGGGEESGEGGEGTRGRRRGCLAAILGRPLGVVTVEVVALVPAPALR